MSSNYVRPPPKECIREFWKTVLQFHQNFFLLAFFFFLVIIIDSAIN